MLKTIKRVMVFLCLGTGVLPIAIGATAKTSTSPAKAGKPTKKVNLDRPVDSTAYDETLDLFKVDLPLVDLFPKQVAPEAPLTINLQVRNNDTAAWPVGALQVEMDIYGPDKAILSREDGVRNDQAVPQGQMTSMRLTYRAPSSFDGDYSIRLRFSVNGQLVLLSEPITFQVQRSGGPSPVPALTGTAAAKFAYLAMSPAEIAPGEGTVLNMVVLNTEKTPWAKSSVSVEAIPIDVKGKKVDWLILPTEAWPDVVPPNGEAFFRLMLKAPDIAPGTYKMVVVVKIGNRVGLVSPPQQFVITPPKPPVKEPPVVMTGNLELTYNTHAHTLAGGGNQSTQLKFVGGGVQVSIKGVIASDALKSFAMNNFVGELATKKLLLRGGQFFPAFSELMFNGTEIRGMELLTNLKKTRVNLVSGEVSKGDPLAGSLARRATGIAFSRTISKRLKGRLAWMRFSDSVYGYNPVTLAGKSPAKAEVFGLDADYDTRFGKGRLVWSRSKGQNNSLLGLQDSLDTAVKVRHQMTWKKIAHEFNVSRMEAGFLALASGGARDSINWSSRHSGKGGNKFTWALDSFRSDNRVSDNQTMPNVITRGQGVNVTFPKPLAKKWLGKLFPNLNFANTWQEQEGSSTFAPTANSTWQRNVSVRYKLAEIYGVAANMAWSQFDDSTPAMSSNKSRRIGLVINRASETILPTLTYNHSNQQVSRSRIKTLTDYYAAGLKIRFADEFNQSWNFSFNSAETAGVPSTGLLLSTTNRVDLIDYGVTLTHSSNYGEAKSGGRQATTTWSHTFSAKYGLSERYSFTLDYRHNKQLGAVNTPVDQSWSLRLTENF